MDESIIKELKSKFCYNYHVEKHWLLKNIVWIYGFLYFLINSLLIFRLEKFSNLKINYIDAGQFGDFVGGYFGTIFGLVSVILLFLTLQNQRESSEIEKFESRFFELIKLHKENLNEIGIGNEIGKKVFVLMMREFRAIREIVSEIVVQKSMGYSNHEILKISYYAFFYGLGPNSSRMLSKSLKQYPKDFVSTVITNMKANKINVKKSRKFKFYPFGGHQSRLGHYYRNLYQIVKFVDSKKIDIDKYNYVKTLRAQLTNHEQALLLINSFTDLGINWWKEGYLIKYKFVKNIPEDFFDEVNEIKINDYFSSKYFEWQK